MAYTLLAFGQFAFGMDTAAFHELQRKMQFKHGAAVRIGARDAYQNLGPGDEVITLQGTVAPEVTGRLASITQLEEMGREGLDHVLVDGTGYVYGVYHIESVDTTHREHVNDGRPRRVDFTVVLERSDNQPSDQPVTTVRNYQGVVQ